MQIRFSTFSFQTIDKCFYVLILFPSIRSTRTLIHKIVLTKLFRQFIVRFSNKSKDKTGTKILIDWKHLLNSSKLIQCKSSFSFDDMHMLQVWMSFVWNHDSFQSFYMKNLFLFFKCFALMGKTHATHMFLKFQYCNSFASIKFQFFVLFSIDSEGLMQGIPWGCYISLKQKQCRN